MVEDVQSDGQHRVGQLAFGRWERFESAPSLEKEVVKALKSIHYAVKIVRVSCQRELA